jgi:4,5-dihydroxyphthalate decarboxylase
VAEVTLRAVLNDTPLTQALKNGAVSSPRIAFEWVKVAPITKAFRPMGNDLAHDVAEMAVGTYLLARAKGRAITALPIVLAKGAVLGGIVARADSSLKDASDLSGKTLGVRAFTQTTGVWARGALAEGAGVDLKSIQWVVYEGAHIDGYEEPSNVRRAAEGKNMQDMLLAGEIDAAVGLDVKGDDRFRSLIADPAAAEAAWIAKIGTQPWNHVVTLRQELVQQHPWLAAELTRLLDESRQSAPAKLPFGLAEVRPGFDQIARYTTEQGIIPRQPSAAESFEAV